MSKLMLAELPYFEDSAPLFEAVADSPWAVFLDSGPPRGGQGRYDIFSADPAVVLVTRANMTEIRAGESVRLSPDDPFDLLRAELGKVSPPAPELPFTGGAIGYFGYDLGRRLERLPSIAEDAEDIPEMAVGIYDWAVVVDHERRRSVLVSAGRDARTPEHWESLAARFRRPARARFRTPFKVAGQVASNMTQEQYARAFGRIHDYIRAGDCYQVNLAQRFSARAEGDPWLAYQGLRAINPAPFAAYLNMPYAQILSASPERFLKLTDRMVETKPIKGTRPRAWHPRDDVGLANELSASAKDRAENLMIVDLLRNDLGKTCETGSVRVPKLFEIESFATVHHLVSTVTGKLASGRDALALLRGSFPGGSITGAPKLRAMEIIEELEPNRRGVYCGSIGYIGFDGNMDSNIAIRTMVYSNSVVRFWAGGGIVADSKMEEEYQETFDKAAALLRFLKQGSVSDVGH